MRMKTFLCACEISKLMVLTQQNDNLLVDLGAEVEVDARCTVDVARSEVELSRLLTLNIYNQP